MDMARAASTTPTGGAQALRRAVAVLRALAGTQDRGARLADVAEQCDLTRPTAHRLLQVLAEEGLAERLPDSARYVIGPDAALLGIARPSALPLRSVADPVLRRVAQATGDSVALTVRSGTDSLCVDRRAGSHPIQVMPAVVGARLPLGVGMGGLAILAFLPEAEIDDVLRRNAARLARRRLTATALRERLRQVRRDGYAFSEAATIPGTHVLAVPVFGADGQPLAALSLSAMAARLPRARARQLVPVLVDGANRLAAAA
ncbi:MAG: IclR family transcriptional regulator [Comamonadaceae bacterium]|nr:MAG: IclR family transcriptional regulator [Comamonadaceae bacterium]